MAEWGQFGLTDMVSKTGGYLYTYYDLVLGVTVVIMVFVSSVLALFFFRGGNKAVNKNWAKSEVLEISWTILPAFILVYLSFHSLNNLYAMELGKVVDYRSKITGHQWYWEYEYFLPKDTLKAHIFLADFRTLSSMWIFADMGPSGDCFLDGLKKDASSDEFTKLLGVLEKSMAESSKGLAFPKMDVENFAGSLLECFPEVRKSLAIDSEVLAVSPVKSVDLPSDGPKEMTDLRSLSEEATEIFSMKETGMEGLKSWFKLLEGLDFSNKESIKKASSNPMCMFYDSVASSRKLSNLKDDVSYKNFMCYAAAVIKTSFVYPSSISDSVMTPCNLDSVSPLGVNVAEDSYLSSDSSSFSMGRGSLRPRMGVADNFFYVAQGKKTAVSVTTADVLHSWGVPSLGIKMDAVPGRVNTFPLSPLTLGVFHGNCYELCGVYHSSMPISVVVLEPSAYEHLLSEMFIKAQEMN